MKNRFLFAASMLLLTDSHCFGQAGSPEQAAFNRAVITFRQAMYAESKRIETAVGPADAESLKSPIRKDTIKDQARRGAARISSCGAAVQVRAGQMCAGEWFGVVREVRRTTTVHVKGGNEPGGYEISVFWCWDATRSVEDAIKAAATAQWDLDKRDDVALLSMGVYERNKELMDIAAALKPGDCIYFRAAYSFGDDGLRMRFSRGYQPEPAGEISEAIFGEANLEFAGLGFAASIMVGADVLSIYPRPLDEAPWRQMQYMQWPIEHGMSAQWLRLVNESDVKKRSEAAYAGAGAVKTRVFAEAVKAGITVDAGAEL